MQIAHYPVLSLGISVEKGREGAGAVGDALMDRHTWDWQRLVDNCTTLLENDVPESATTLPQPITLRFQLLPRGAERPEIDDRSFSLVDGQWYERRRGSADVTAITDYVRAVDQQRDCWALVYFTMDLSAESVDGVNPSKIADHLSAFAPIRRRLRGVPIERAV